MRALRKDLDHVTRARTTFVVGIDPGDSTGLVVIRGDGFRPHFEQGPPSLLDNFVDRFPFLRHPGHDVLIACERFVVNANTARHSAQPTAPQVIGVVQQVSRLLGVPLYLQSPSEAKNLIDNATLRQLGLWLSGRDVGRPDANDVNDAQRHALTVLALHRASLFDRLLRVTSM